MFCVAASAVIGAVAAPLTPEEALDRLASDSPERAAGARTAATPALTVRTAENTPAAYVFTNTDGRGYMIVSADDVAFPLLGYSDTGIFDPQNIPANMQWWLDGYARQIEWASKAGVRVPADRAVGQDWQAVAPLVKSKWDQGEPYNNDCPKPSGSSIPCYTGCVATSMAQVMNYFKYPEVGEGSVNFYAPKIQKTLMMNFSRKKFDWANMLDNYVSGEYNETQADAVAYLMKACGYSVEMSYGPDASGAQGSSIANALRTYFKYDQGCRSEQRIMYSMSTWSQMVYDNLKNVGPVIINGRDFDGSMGHSFICDGYDGKGLYHFNWGWSGMSDGYFSLDALNPDAMGIGGYGGGFNHGQNAIFGIRPASGQTYVPNQNIVQYGNMTATVSGTTINFGTKDYDYSGWGNPFDYSIKGNVGVRFKPTEGGNAVVVDASLNGSSAVSISEGRYYSAESSTLKATIPALADGKYRVTLMFKPENGDWKEALTPWGFNNYVFITKSGSKYTVTVPAANELKVDKAEIASELYYNKNTLFKIKFSNDSDFELSQGVVPMLYLNGVPAMQASGVLVTVGAHQTQEQEIISMFIPVNGHAFVSGTEYTFCLFDPVNNKLYGEYGKVTMNKAPSMTSVVSTDFNIKDASLIDYQSGESKIKSYLVQDTSSFEVDFGYMVRIGYFDGRVKLAIFEVDPANSYKLLPVVDEVYAEAGFMNMGESRQKTVTVNFPEAAKDKPYALRLSYTESRSWKTLSTIYFVTGVSSVEGIEMDADSMQVEYFNLQGMPVAHPEKGQVLIRRSGDKTAKIVY